MCDHYANGLLRLKNELYSIFMHLIVHGLNFTKEL